jgi:xylulokinase
MRHGEAAGNPIVCIGLSGQMHGTVFLGEDDLPLAPAVIWPDQRSIRQVAEITEIVGSERLIHIAGGPAATGFQAATIRWFQQNRPDIWNRVRKILLPKDYLQRRLTGEYHTDPSDASGTLLFDIRRRNWSTQLLDIMEVNPNQLPQVRASDAIGGTLSKEASEALGLSTDVPVVTGAGDVACGLLGAGVTNYNTLLLTISTGGPIALPVAGPVVDADGRIHTFLSAIKSTNDRAGYYQLGAILAAGHSLRWLREQILSDSEQIPYSRLTEWAAKAPAGSNGLIYLPYIAGERTPHMNPEAKGALLGLTIQHGREEMVRAVMEGVAMACFDAYSVLRDLDGSPDLIVMAGGGARSRLWRQIIADIFNLPVQSPVVREQAAYGAAMLAGSGAGYHKLPQAARQWSNYGAPIEPNPQHHEQYRSLFDIYRSAYRATQIEPFDIQ